MYKRVKKEKRKGMGGWEKIADRTIAKQKKWPNGIEDPLEGPCAESAMEKLPPREGRSGCDLRLLVMLPSPIITKPSLGQAQNNNLASLVGGGKIGRRVFRINLETQS